MSTELERRVLQQADTDTDTVTVTVTRGDAHFLVNTWADLTGTRGRIVDAYRTALEAAP